MSTNAALAVACDLKDISLADAGKRRMDWALQSMPVLQSVPKQFIKGQPLAGVRIAACLNVTAETANLMVTLRESGAAVVLCGSNPLSTQDDVAALANKVYAVPEELDRHVARLKLEAMGVKIDRLNVEQEKYLSNCTEGTEVTDRRVSLGVN